jgi:hypothetical protein
MDFTRTVLILFAVIGSSYCILLLSTFLVYGILILIFDQCIALLTRIERPCFLFRSWVAVSALSGLPASSAHVAVTFLADAGFLAP